MATDRTVKIMTNKRMAFVGFFHGSNGYGSVTQHEDESLTYTIDYSDWLQVNETISSVTLTPDGLTVSGQTTTTTSTTFTASAVAHDPAELVLLATTSDNQIVRHKLRFYQTGD